jgi:ribonuclease HII
MLKQFYNTEFIEAGCDEAGRGCLAGPVFAASVILPRDFQNELLNDSKKLNEKQRNLLKDIIIENAIEWSVAEVDNVEIDKINILNASFLAMHRAIDKLKTKPELLLIDGNRFKKYNEINHLCIIKGDGEYMSIAAASILAKTFRDDFMIKIHNEFPQYKWAENKGYPTIMHKRAIKEHGVTPYHRLTFNMTEQLKMEF